MKNIRTLFAVLGLASSALIFAPGCASTATKASTGELLDDSVVTTKVKTALVRDDATPGTAIGVDTFKGVVQLSGFVSSDGQKTQAGIVAAKVDGVTKVVNDIAVTGVEAKSSTGEFIDDSVITTKVKTALVRDDATPGSAIKVATYKGSVQLSGFVDTAVQKTQAGVVAAKVEGAKGVVNNIIVK